MYAKMIAIGNLGRDAEVRTTNGGTKVMSFSVAVNTRERNTPSTMWVNVSVFNERLADALASFLTKGRQVYVEGRPSIREYESKGERRYSLDIIANEIRLLGNRGDDPAPQTRQAPAATADDDFEYDDDVPF